MTEPDVPPTLPVPVERRERKIRVDARGERFDEQNRRLCHHKRKHGLRAGTMCCAPCCKGRDYCRRHGGKSRVGPANGAWKHGRYSKFFQQAGLGAQYESVRSDPDWLSLREDLHSLETRLLDLHARLTGAAQSCHWEKANGLLRQYCDALQAGAPSAGFLLTELRALIEAGAAEEHTWDKIGETMELRRKLADVEGRTQERLGQTFTTANALIFQQAMAQLAREYVPGERLNEFVQRLRLATLGAIHAARLGADT